MIEDAVTEDVDFGKCYLISEPRVYVNMTAHVECERRRQRALDQEPVEFIDATAKPPGERQKRSFENVT